MLKRILFAAILSLSLSIAPAFANLGIGVGLKASSLGLGAEVSKSIGKKFTVRGGMHQLTYNMTGDMPEQKAGYSADLKLNSWSALADWHPWSGTFYVSGGLIGNSNKVIGTITPSAPRSAGDRTYSVAEQGSLTAEITWPSSAPYIGIGWGNPAGEGADFFMDIGAMLQGSPKVAMHGTGLIAASAANAKQVEEDLKGATTWVVVTIGFAFGF